MKMLVESIKSTGLRTGRSTVEQKCACENPETDNRGLYHNFLTSSIGFFERIRCALASMKRVGLLSCGTEVG